MVERIMVRPPSARIGPITMEERAKIQSNSPVKGKYDVTVDAESAYEVLQKRVGQTAQPGAPGAPQGEAPAGGGWLSSIGGLVGGIFGTNRPRGARLTPSQAVARDVTRPVTNRVAGQIAANLAQSDGRSIGGTGCRAVL